MSGRRRRQVEQLERVFGIGGGPPLSAVGRAKLRVERCVATSEDFAVAFEECIPFLRVVIISLSRVYALSRYFGWEPWAFHPLDVAAAIVALPVGVTPSRELLEYSGWMVGERLPRPKGNSAIAKMARRPELHTRWVQTNLNVVAMGAPDGLRLREQMAAGMWDGAVEARAEYSDLDDLVSFPWPFRRWYELPVDFPRSLPFEMTAEQANKLGPPWEWRMKTISEPLPPVPGPFVDDQTSVLFPSTIDGRSDIDILLAVNSETADPDQSNPST